MPATKLKVLIVEDDFTSRLLLQKLLQPYGEGHIAVNGREAVSAFREALETGQPYDLVCLDIMMPEKDGHEALKEMRALEESRNIVSTQGAKVIMTTAMGDVKNVAAAYDELCDGYLVKPIDKAKLIALLEELQLSPKESRR
jgi:two-component system, chemotaxis family, chemotaxis protein CheY